MNGLGYHNYGEAESTFSFFSEIESQSKINSSDLNRTKEEEVKEAVSSQSKIYKTKGLSQS